MRDSLQARVTEPCTSCCQAVTTHCNNTYKKKKSCLVFLFTCSFFHLCRFVKTKFDVECYSFCLSAVTVYLPINIERIVCFLRRHGPSTACWPLVTRLNPVCQTFNYICFFCHRCDDKHPKINSKSLLNEAPETSRKKLHYISLISTLTRTFTSSLTFINFIIIINYFNKCAHVSLYP